MDRKLTAKDYLFLSSMLFGLFFGAGNLIFPASMGQNAGANLWPAIAGFCLTGVGLPLLGIVAMGISRSEGMFDMASKVGRRYSYFFTCALYLTIGPLFAIPRTATVSFSVGILPMLSPEHETLALCVFSALFFLVVLYFSLRPSGILTWVGKILNPLFLLFLGILTVTALIRPMGDPAALEPMGNYAHMSFFQGFLDGYNPVDRAGGPGLWHCADHRHPGPGGPVSQGHLRQHGEGGLFQHAADGRHLLHAHGGRRSVPGSVRHVR